MKEKRDFFFRRREVFFVAGERKTFSIAASYEFFENLASNEK
jgi:hypothetical protein